MDDDTQSSLTLSVAQAAEYVGVSAKTIYRAVEDGRLRASALGRSTALRIRPEWIEQWIEEATYVPAERPRSPRLTPYSGGAERRQPRRGFLHG